MDARHADIPGASRRDAVRRLAVAGAVLATVFGAVAATGSLPTPDEARDWGEGLGDLAFLLFVPLFVVANFVIVWTVLAAAAGLLFGTAVGTPLALAGVTGAALAQMLLARRLAQDHHGRLLPRRTRPIEEFLTRNGVVAVMESRIVPILPYGLVNYSAGLTRLGFRDMGIGTAVGAAPKVFAYVALGGSLTDFGSPATVLAVALLVALGLGGLFVVRRQIVAERGTASA